MINKGNLNGDGILAPYCKLMISVGGILSELPADMRDMIEEYSIEVNESGATLLTFTVQDPDYVLINSSILTESTAVYFEGGWLNDWDNIARFNGYVSLVYPTFPENGYPYLDITCMDETHVMNRVEKTRTFENMKRSDVAKKIFKEYGIPCSVSDSGERADDIEKKITQSNKTDIAFLQDLAGEVIGGVYICYLKDGHGYWCSRDFSAEPQIDLHYRQETNDISSFSCSINKDTKKVYKSTSNVNTSTKTTEIQTASSPSSTTKTATDTKSVNNTTWKFGIDGKVGWEKEG